MKEPSVTLLKKYLAAMSKIKAKYITSERLSRVVGVYPEVINENLSYFDPLIMMDYEYNLLELVPTIKKYIEDKESGASNAPKAPLVTKKVASEFDSVVDFVYKKMSIGGLVDKSTVLTDKDLRILKHLVNDELNSRRICFGIFFFSSDFSHLPKCFSSICPSPLRRRESDDVRKNLSFPVLIFTVSSLAELKYSYLVPSEPTFPTSETEYSAVFNCRLLSVGMASATVWAIGCSSI